jgi:hypothetical protein
MSFISVLDNLPVDGRLDVITATFVDMHVVDRL